MKKQDLIQLLKELPHSKEVHVWAENEWFAMDSKGSAMYLIDWLTYECHVDNEQDIFNLSVDGEVVYTKEQQDSMYGEQYLAQLMQQEHEF